MLLLLKFSPLSVVFRTSEGAILTNSVHRRVYLPRFVPLGSGWVQQVLLSKRRINDALATAEVDDDSMMSL